MATMKDVADLAGVSTTTVSHLLNGTRYVSPDLSERVLEAIKELKYRPYGIARSLRRKESRMIATVIPDNTNPYFAEIARRLEDSCFDAGYNVIVCNSDGSPEKEFRYLELLLEKGVDGIVFVATGRDPDSIEMLREQRLPLVVVDRDVEFTGGDTVLIDNTYGGTIATEYLLEHGHRRLGCISGPCGLRPSMRRVSGFLSAAASYGITVPEDSIVAGSFTSASGYEALLQVLGRDDPPTGVFVCNDMMAVGAICAAQELGYTIPHDLSLVGYDGIELTRYTSPPLTTVEQPFQRLADRTIELLLSRIADPDYEPRREILQPRLIERSSCMHYEPARSSSA